VLDSRNQGIRIPASAGKGLGAEEDVERASSSSEIAKRGVGDGHTHRRLDSRAMESYIRKGIW